MTPQEKLLTTLVALQTMPTNKKELQAAHELIIAQLKSLPVYIRTLHDGDLPITVITSRQTTTPRILFVCHVDVVIANNSMFRVHSDEQRLYGRGIWDMKYSIAGILALMQRLGDDIAKYDFGLAITSDEETTNHNMQYLLDNRVKPECVVIFDGGENWQLESGAKGCWTVKLISEGCTAHGSRPWEGKNAVEPLLDALAAIRPHFIKQEPTTPTLNISMLSGGKVQNQIPDHASAVLDLRFVTNAELDGIKQLVSETAKQYSLTVETMTEMAPVIHDLNNKYLRSFQAAITEVTKQVPSPVLSQGSSDAAMCISRGIPAIVTRPLGGGHHADQEWIDRDSFALFDRIVLAFLARVAD